MKHNLNDAAVRAAAINEFNAMLRSWRPKALRSKRVLMYQKLVVACECGILALGGDPDGPDTYPPEPPKAKTVAR